MILGRWYVQLTVIWHCHWYLPLWIYLIFLICYYVHFFLISLISDFISLIDELECLMILAPSAILNLIATDPSEMFVHDCIFCFMPVYGLVLWIDFRRVCLTKVVI